MTDETSRNLRSVCLCPCRKKRHEASKPSRATNVFRSMLCKTNRQLVIPDPLTFPTTSHIHTSVNKQELNTPNAIACSLPVLDLPPTTLVHAPRLLSLDSGSFRKQLSHVQSNTRKIESNGEVVKHALQAQELSNRTQATLLKAQLNAMFIFWKKKNAHCELRIRVASKMCPTFEAHHSCKRCIDRTQLPCLQTVLQIAPFPEGAYH